MTLARPRLAFACFVAGALLVVAVDAPLARIVGVPLLFAGIALGVVAIATPEFLEGERDERARPPEAPRVRSR